MRIRVILQIHVFTFDSEISPTLWDMKYMTKMAKYMGACMMSMTFPRKFFLEKNEGEKDQNNLDVKTILKNYYDLVFQRKEECNNVNHNITIYT